MDVEITIPSPGESITEVVLESWLVEDGAFVKKGEDLFEVESEKATLSIPAEISGTLIRKAEEGQALQVGDVACLITAAEEDSSSHAQSEKIESTATSMPKAEEPQKQTATASLSHSEPIESPRSEKGETAPSSNEEEVQGEAVVEKITQQGEDAESEVRKEERKKLSPLRKKIAQRLVAVRNETAMLTTFNEVNMSRVKAIRESYQSEFVEKHGVKLGYMSFFIKAVSIAMKNFPDINAMIDGDEVVHFNYLDMGVSVSAPKGLVVPVIRNADQLSLWDIEKEIKRLAGKARDLTLSIDEMSGGTFTITNGGVFGSLLSTPILNPPQSAILGMHNIVERPIAVEGKVEIHPMMYVALSYDHRIVDGRESVGFLKNVKELIEDPVRFLLEI